MAKTPGNAQALLLRIFGAWQHDSCPERDGGAAFEIFASELALRSYGLTFDQVITGVVGGGQDGAVDSVYVFFDGDLVDEDSEVVLPESRPAAFGQERSLELWVVQAKRTPSFSETVLDKLENTLRRVLDLGEPLDTLAALYNAGLLARFDLFRQAWEKLLTRRPKLSVNIIYATPGDRRNITPQVETKALALQLFLGKQVPGALPLTERQYVGI